MWSNSEYERCLSFINSQLCSGSRNPSSTQPVKPAITISRMAGCGGQTVAAKLAEYLQELTPADCRWTVFDRNLLEKVLEDHQLQKRIADFMPENHKSIIADIVEESWGLHPSSWTIVEQTAETILHLAQLGYVILVGRGANIITSKLDNVLHVRLVGSLQKRIQRVQQAYDLDGPAALELIKREDKGRKCYLRDHFGRDIDDPSLYDLMINTDRTHYDDAARLLCNEVVRRFNLNTRGQAAEGSLTSGNYSSVR